MLLSRVVKLTNHKCSEASWIMYQGSADCGVPGKTDNAELNVRIHTSGWLVAPPSYSYKYLYISEMRLSFSLTT